MSNSIELKRTELISVDIMSGTWTQKDGFEKAAGYDHKEIPRFFRIGTVPTKPWAYKKMDSNGQVLFSNSKIVSLRQ